MLSDELREAQRAVDFEIRRGTCSLQIWTAYCERVEEIAERLAAYEHAAGPGPASRGDTPAGANVVMLRPDGPA